MSEHKPIVLARFENVTPEKMDHIAERIALVCLPGDVITLRGDLGAGKTSFARAFIRSITPAPEVAEVTSPTFNLMQSYEVMLATGARDILWHLDLYRLEGESEADALGMEELEKHIMLIEWPEIIEKRLPRQRLDINIDFGRNDNERSLIIAANGTWPKRLASL